MALIVPHYCGISVVLLLILLLLLPSGNGVQALHAKLKRACRQSTFDIRNYTALFHQSSALPSSTLEPAPHLPPQYHSILLNSQHKSPLLRTNLGNKSSANSTPESALSVRSSRHLDITCWNDASIPTYSVAADNKVTACLRFFFRLEC